jgi:predicted nucleic acid-binding protein
VILYCDTSALVKRYVNETGTDLVDAAWEQASAIATSVVAYAESMAAFHRRHREGRLTPKNLRRICDKFKGDYKQIVLVPADHHLHHYIDELLKHHLLRGFDAIHLASALIFNSDDKEPIVFACFDASLNKAAEKEGLRTLPETNQQRIK